MRLRQHIEPSLRDFEIFWAAHDGATQRGLADKHDLSQPRISQIIGKVAEWIACIGPQRADHTPLQASYLACAKRQHDVEKHQRYALETHQKMCGRWEMDEKPPKLDYRWLKLADDFSQRNENVAQRLAELGEKVAKEAEREGKLAEDHAVYQAQVDIEALRETMLEGQAEGLFPPGELPAYDEREIELCVRNALRREQVGRHLRNSERLPPAWQEIVKKVYYELLGGLSEEQILAANKEDINDNKIAISNYDVSSCDAVAEDVLPTEEPSLMTYQTEPAVEEEVSPPPAVEEIATAVADAPVAPVAPVEPKPERVVDWDLLRSKGIYPTRYGGREKPPPPGPNTIRLQAPVCTPMRGGSKPL